MPALVDSTNVEMARAAMEAFNARDLDTFDRCVTDEFEWVTPTASNAEPRTFRGRDGIREFFEYVSNWATVEARVEEWRDLGDEVFLIGEVFWRGHHPQLFEVSCPLLSLWSFEAGKLKRTNSAMAQEPLTATPAA